MLKSIPVCLLLLGTLALPIVARSQTRSTHTEPDQELDEFSGRYPKLHVFSARLRGVRAAHETTYWVSSDGRQLAAYQAGKRRWLLDVVASFQGEIPAAHIVSLVLAADILFVNLGPRGMAEVDRKTGRIVATYFDRDPQHLVAD
jgi:hypothetical protein